MLHEKTCTKCGESKPLTSFSRKKRNRDGRNARCKKCVSEYHRQWYLKNQEKRVAKQANYRQENPEKVRQSRRRYRQENPEKERAYRERNREKYLEYQRKYRAQNEDKLRDYQRSYREENRERRREYQREYRRANAEHVRSRTRMLDKESSDMSRALSTIPPYTPWSEDEEAFILKADGRTLYQKAVELGRSYYSVKKKRQSLSKRNPQ